MKKAVKQGAVIEKEFPEIFVNGKDTMAVWDIYQFEGHSGSAFHGILGTAGRAETAVASERNKFKFSTMGTAIHGTAEGRIATVDHFIDVFHLRISGMKGIFNFFIIVGKNFLQDIHKTIMKENGAKRNP